MKKLFLLGIACLLASGIANAETVSGKIVKTKHDMLTLRTEDGEKMDLQTTDNTTYRERKVRSRGKKIKGRTMSADTYYRPMVEEDDWVEITYTPAKNDMQSAEVQEVIVYDD